MARPRSSPKTRILYLALILSAAFLTALAAELTASNSQAPETKPHDESSAPQESPDHAEKDAVPAGEGHAPPAEAAKPAHRLGPPIKSGYFDLTTLRAARRVSRLRYDLEERSYPLEYRGEKHDLTLGIALEFGTESGLAESSEAESSVQEAIEHVLSRFRLPDLMTTSGKMRLKEEIIRKLNQQFKTARVRRVYFTSYLIVKGAR